MLGKIETLRYMHPFIYFKIIKIIILNFLLFDSIILKIYSYQVRQCSHRPTRPVSRRMASCQFVSLKSSHKMVFLGKFRNKLAPIQASKGRSLNHCWASVNRKPHFRRIRILLWRNQLDPTLPTCWTPSSALNTCIPRISSGYCFKTSQIGLRCMIKICKAPLINQMRTSENLAVKMCSTLI